MRPPSQYDDPIIRRLRSERGMLVKAAHACGRTRQAVSQWTRVPPECAVAIADLLDLHPADVRPDIFPRR